MTSYQPVTAVRVTPAKLAIAGAVIFLVSIVLTISGANLLSGVSATLAMYTSLLARAAFTAGIVLLVLAVVRRLDRR